MNIFNMDLNMQISNIKMENNYVQGDVSFKKDKETRKEQTCSLCQNHGESNKKKGHKCLYDKKEHFDNCEPCKMTKERRLFASKDKKNNYQKKKNFGQILNANTEPSVGTKRKDQKCRKCANHGLLRSMKDHKNSCEFLNCECRDCIGTEKRRFAVKHEAKAKRQKNKIKQEVDDSMSSGSSSPSESGYNSDNSTSSLPSNFAIMSLPSVNSGFLESTPFNCNFEFKCKEETKYWNCSQTPNYSPSPIHYGPYEPTLFAEQFDFRCNENKKFWDMDFTSNSRTTDYYTNTSSNTFQNIVTFPIKTEVSENFVQNCTNFTADESLIQSVIQGLLNKEFNFDEFYDSCDDSLLS